MQVINGNKFLARTLVTLLNCDLHKLNAVLNTKYEAELSDYRRSAQISVYKWFRFSRRIVCVVNYNLLKNGLVIAERDCTNTTIEELTKLAKFIEDETKLPVTIITQ